MIIETNNAEENKKNNYIMSMIDERKTIVLNDKKTNKKNNKTKIYYIYQTTLFRPFLRVIIPPNATDTKLYLVKRNKNTFQIVHDKPIFDDCIQLKHGLPSNEEKEIQSDIESYVLPKRYIKYLQSYDKYQDIVRELNKNGADYKIAPLYTELRLNCEVNKETDKAEFSLYLRIYTKFNDYKFYEDIKSKNDGNIPDWFNTLLTDKNKKEINSYFKRKWISNTVIKIDNDGTDSTNKAGKIKSKEMITNE